jgi:hypothetical protein
MHKQIKKKRSTLHDAHAFHVQGSYLFGSPDDYVSDKERRAELSRIHDELVTLLKKQFPRTSNLEYAILKSHLIIEYLLTEYIRFHAYVFIEREQIRFSFSQKVEVAYLMGSGANDPSLIPTIQLLNKVRNQVAHTFEVDRKLVDEMVRLHSKDYKDFKMTNDRERITGLRQVCALICGITHGFMQGSFVAAGGSM